MKKALVALVLAALTTFGTVSAGLAVDEHATQGLHTACDRSGQAHVPTCGP